MNTLVIVAGTFFFSQNIGYVTPKSTYFDYHARKSMYLVHISVEHEIGIACVHELLEKFRALILGVNKHEDLSVLRVLAQKLQQSQETVLFRAEFYKLGDVRVHHGPASYLDLNRRVQQCSCKRLNL